MSANPKREATALLKDSDQYTLPVNVLDVAKFLGAQVVYENFEDGMSGVLLVKNGKCAIAVNSAHHPNRQRFTIAHEIGHFVLHHKHSNNDVHLDKKWAYFRSASPDSVDSQEVEANQFAAELLMPEQLLKLRVKQAHLDLSNDIDISLLARDLIVSEHALTIRLVKLRLIEPY